jgi:DNA (cytosine-5)-methyltransferase 1
MGGGQREPKVAIKTWNDETKAYKTKEVDMPRDRIYTEDSIGFTITTNESQMPCIAELRTDEGIRTFKDGLVGTLRTTESCGDKIVIEESIAIKEATAKGYAEATDGDGVYLNRPEQKRGVVQKGMIQTLKTSGSDVGVVVKQKSRGYNKGEEHELCPTITTSSWEENNHLVNNLRIRKLTPLECWRLMGISDGDFLKAQASGMSNAQLYKQAGNGIVVNVFEAILRNLFKE